MNAMKLLTKGKPKVKKRGRSFMGEIYLLSVDGDLKGTRAPERWYQAPNMTRAYATIYDSETDRVSKCSVYNKNGFYFKKNGVIYRLDNFK